MIAVALTLRQVESVLVLGVAACYLLMVVLSRR